MERDIIVSILDVDGTKPSLADPIEQTIHDKCKWQVYDKAFAGIKVTLLDCVVSVKNTMIPYMIGCMYRLGKSI